MSLGFTPKLLIVDDREDNLILLKAMLDSVDVVFELIQSPYKALQATEQSEYALIILDVQMPQMDGFMLAEKIRGGKLNRFTPVIFLTAFYLNKESELKGYKKGCVDFIVKPFDSVILINKVNIFLELYRSKKEVEQQNKNLESALKEKGSLENKLRNLASKYRMILEGQSELIFKFDRSLKIEFANKAFTDFFDYALDGVYENTLSDINAELAKQLQSAIKNMDGKKQAVLLEQPIANSQSESRWIEWSVFKEMEFDDVHYVVVGHDVSESRRIKDSLSRKEKLVEKIQQTSRIGVWEWDSFAKIVRGSDEFYRLYEIPHQDSKDVFKLIKLKTHPDDRGIIERMLLHLPRKNQKLEFQHRTINEGGKVKHFKVVIYCEYNKNSDILDLYGISCDISYHKILELTAKEGICRNRDIYIDKTFFELDGQYAIGYLNDFGQKFLECKEPKTVEGVSFFDFFRNQDKPKLEKMLGLASKKQILAFEEFRIVTQKGNFKNVVILASPINETGSEFAVRGLILDVAGELNNGKEKVSPGQYQKVITRLKHEEKEFEASRKQFQEKVEQDLKVNEFQHQLLLKKSELESLGKIASSVVHEINQPLTAISMGMDNILLRLSMDNIDEGYIRDKCSQVFQDIDRIKKYLSQIGIYNSSQNKNKNSTIDVNTIVRDAINLVEKQYQNSLIEVKLEINPDKLFVCGNKYKLQKVIADILINSFESIGDKAKKDEKASDEWIKVSTDLVDNDVVISIKDNGSGIDPKNLNYIFEPFFTTKHTGIASGLGLYIGKEVVQKMNGKIAVSSKKDEFTEMKLVLPFQDKKEMNFKDE